MRRITFILFFVILILQFFNQAHALTCNDYEGTWQGQAQKWTATVKMHAIDKNIFSFNMHISDGRGLSDNVNEIVDCHSNHNGNPEIIYSDNMASLHLLMSGPNTTKITGNLYIYGSFSSTLTRLVETS